MFKSVETTDGCLIYLISNILESIDYNIQEIERCFWSCCLNYYVCFIGTDLSRLTASLGSSDVVLEDCVQRNFQKA